MNNEGYLVGLGEFKKLKRLVALGRTATFFSNNCQPGNTIPGLRPAFNPQFKNGSIADVVGNTVPTFIRALAAAVTDHEQIMRTAKAGEVRFTGLRRVENRVTGNSESIANGGTWGISTCTQIPAVLAGPFGDPITCGKLITANGTATTNNDAAGGATETVSVVNGFFVYSIFAKAAEVTTLRLREGTVTGARFVFDLINGIVTEELAGGGVTAAMSRCANGWWRCSIMRAATSAATQGINVKPGLAVGDGISGVYLTGRQAESNPGTSVTLMHEYVSVGVQVAPVYHGAAVDGVKYFPWLCGNTLAGNIVTEAQGAMIAEATRLGYFAETQVRTNSLLQSNTFTVTWAPTGVSTPNPTQNTVGPNGINNSAWTLTDNDAAAFEGLQQSVTVPNDSNTHVFSIFIKKTSGGTSATVGINYSLTVGVTPVNANIRINTDNGAVLSGTAVVESYNANWWRVSGAITNNSTGNTTCTVSFFPATAANGVGLDNAAATGSAAFYGAQLELNVSFASSYIETTTLAVSRPADTLQYPQFDPSIRANGSAYAQVQLVSVLGLVSPMVIRLGDNTGRPLWNTGGAGNETTMSIYDGVTSSTKVGLSDITTGQRKRASSWGSAGTSVTGDGAVPQNNPFDGSMGIAGNIDVGINNIFMHLAEVALYPYQLTDSMLQTLTV